MKILGIETSCDETAAAVAEFKNNKITILSNIVSSQIEIHKKYGGVVPEVAAREHVLNILPVVHEALKKSGIEKTKNRPDAIAVTIGPGLITSLQTGAETAKVLSYVWGIPLLKINHIEGHISANFISDSSIADLQFPAIILTVSGGHTMLVLMENFGKFKTIGETLDDAAGEAFDKAAKLMGIGYPGGPAVSAEAKKFTTLSSSAAYQEKLKPIKFPRPLLNSSDLNFSFSGLKTAIRYALEKDPDWKNKIPEYCHAFQQAVMDVLIKKTIRAATKFEAKTIMLAGGVAANQELREQFKKQVKKELPKALFTIPDLKYTTDNAAMIAAAGCLKIKEGKLDAWLDLRVDCNLKL